MSDARGRPRIAGGLSATAVVLAALALVLSYAGRAILRPEPFADRATATLRDAAVQADLADHVADAIVHSGNGDLITLRPIVRSVTGNIVASDAFAALFRRAVLNVHRAVIEHSGNTIGLTVPDAGVLVAAALERFAPAAAQKIGAARPSEVISVRPGTAVLGVARAMKRALSLAWILLVLAVVAAVGAVWLSRDRRRSIRRLGVGLVAAGLVIAVLVTAGGVVAAHAAAPGRSDVARALWVAFLGGLRTQALCVAAAGALSAAAASAGVRRLAAGELPGLGSSFASAGRSTPGRRVAAALALIAGGSAAVLEPAAMLTIGVTAVGLLVLYTGAELLLSAIILDSAVKTAAEHHLRQGIRRLIRGAVGVAALGGVLAFVAAGGADGAPAGTPMKCNGYIELCDRRLNEVALAATHNSMGSVTIPDWLFGQQDGTISQQLADGIRGLLIDTHYGFSGPRGVRTDLAPIDDATRAAYVQRIGAPAVDAALRIRKRLEYKGHARREIFLCHAFCELGAIRLSAVLADLRSFLVSNPWEIVVVINQDEGASPTDIERAFDKAGLLDLVYSGPLGPFPTLREMIDSGQRLLVLAENNAGTGIPWYRLAYQHALQETPYTFKTTGKLTDPSNVAASCRPNRGPASAPLFLVNNWVDTTPAPRASNAAIVNARTPLLARAQRCEQIRGRVPNLIAVDFYRHGDILSVVDAVNRLAR
jgi:hypothetical protein